MKSVRSDLLLYALGPSLMVGVASLLELQTLWVMLLAGLGGVIVTFWLNRRKLTEPNAVSPDKRTLDFMQRVFEAIPYPLYIKDARSCYLMMNDAFLDAKKLPKERLIGSHGLVYEKIPFDPAAVRRHYEEDGEILGGRIIKKEEYITHHHSTEEIFRVINKKMCEGIDGEPVIVGIHISVTEQRLAQRAAQEALVRETELRRRTEEYTQRLIDVIPQPVYVKDSESRYLMVNEAFATDAGLDIKVFPGKKGSEIWGPSANHNSARAEDMEVINGASVYKEVHLPSLRGREVFRFISKRSCIDTQDRRVIVGANFDITSLRIAERNLKEALTTANSANEAKSVFLATMSHEIRTPLNGVIGMLRIAMRDELPSNTHEKLEIGLNNAESLLSIINDILDFSKIEAGELALEHIDFDICKAVAESVEVFQNHAKRNSLDFVVDIPADMPRFLIGDPTRLRQVLINLVGNAIKFTERGSITVQLGVTSLDADTCHIHCSVIDTGIGISEEALKGLFRKFHQADVSTTRRFGGTGLGLAICKQLIEAMGGSISARSTPSGGTEFFFDIPMPLGRAPFKQVLSDLTPHSHRLSILCAEDDATNQIIIESELEEMGHRVTLVDNGREAVLALGRNDYDIVLMDGRMPIMDGLDATKLIRQGGLPDAPVLRPNTLIIALTANASNEDRDIYLAAGMDGFLTKPIIERALHDVLSDAITLRLAQGVVLDAQGT